LLRDDDRAAASALAPDGVLRAAFLTGPLYATPDAGSGRYRGVVIDLGELLARQLGVAFEPRPQPGVAAILAGAQEGRFDVVFLGISAERAATIAFSPPYLEVEQGVLLNPGVPVQRLEEIDRPGLRIGVLERAGADAHLTQHARALQIVRLPSLDGVFAELAAGRIDMAAATKSRLIAEAGKRPGTRILDGRLLIEPIGIGVARSRPAAAVQRLARFIEQAKASGAVADAVRRAGLTGVSVPA
jgi:polar amino acid transport system substrate-binding protein